MEVPFRVKVSKDLLSASLEIIGPFKEGITANELEAFLKEENIHFGINHQLLHEISVNPIKMDYPIIVAEGLPPQQGEDAYLVAEYPSEKKNKKKEVNFRHILDIPSVKKGQIIARIVPETYGTNGTTVTGQTLLPRKGKPLKVRAGKNVIKLDNQFIASIDGQVSITTRSISVNPVFEVTGDLDLKTGNVHFIGNVVIRGDVPTGYVIEAGGDIRIYGLVEGAQLIANGNILVSGGITGGNRGHVSAGGTIQANYLNQADVQAVEDIIIHSSLLHSKVEAGGAIICKNGPIIGGQIFSGKDIHVKEIGNHLYTKTELTMGYNPAMEQQEIELIQESEKVSENIKKLAQIEQILLKGMQQKAQVSLQEKEVLVKQRATKEQLTLQLKRLQQQLLEVKHEKERSKSASLFIYEKIHPNTVLHFGKQSRVIQRVHTYVKFYIEDGEIMFESIG